MHTSESIQVEIPPLYCPIPFAIHPAVQRVEERSLAWMDKYGFSQDLTLRATIVGSNAAEGIGLSLPNASEDRLQIFSDWCYLGVVLEAFRYSAGNHGTADFAPLAGRILWTLETTQAGLLDDSPLTDAIIDVAVRMRQLLTATQYRRWVEGHRRWFMGTLWEKAATRDRTPLTLNEYAAMRMDSVAGAALFSACEFSRAGAEISDREMDSPSIRALTQLCWLLVGWDNDLFSHTTERWLAERTPEAVGAVPTLVTVLAEQQSLSWPDALQRAVEIRDHLMSLFLQLRNQVLPDASPQLCAYLTEAGHTIRGNLAFYLSPRTHRYTNPDGKSPNTFTYTTSFTDVPPVGAEEPLPISSISWWWDQLH